MTALDQAIIKKLYRPTDPATATMPIASLFPGLATPHSLAAGATETAAEDALPAVAAVKSRTAEPRPAVGVAEDYVPQPLPAVGLAEPPASLAMFAASPVPAEALSGPWRPLLQVDYVLWPSTGDRLQAAAGDALDQLTASLTGILQSGRNGWDGAPPRAARA